MEYAFPILAWLLSFTGTRISLPLLVRHGVIDTPNARSNHKAAVPRGGGIAMIAVILLFLALYGIDMRIVAAAALLAAVSFTDDMRGLPVRWRLLAQIIAVALAVSALHGRLLPPFIPLAVERIFIAVLWLWFINLTNFMDGIDGITSLEVIAIACGVCVVSVFARAYDTPLVEYAGVIAMATLGFYWFNRSPARLFMGDIGSIVLGFLTFCLLVRLALHHAVIPALILPAYYVSDASFTLARRLLRGERIWQAHSEHAYQRAVRGGMSHAEVARLITLLNILLVALALNAVLNSAAGIALLAIAYITAACVMRCFYRSGTKAEN